MNTVLHNTRFAVKNVLSASYLHANVKSALLQFTTSFVQSYLSKPCANFMHINSPIRINWGNTISNITIPRERPGFIFVTFTDVSYSYNFMLTTSLWDELFMLPHTSSDLGGISPFIQTSFSHGIPTRTNSTFSNLMQDSADAPILPHVLSKSPYRSLCSIWFLRCPTECASNHTNFPSHTHFPQFRLTYNTLI
jgi:hypothetical protein